MNSANDELMQRIQRDLMDSYDEELEMEIEDRVWSDADGAPPAPETPKDKEARRIYFR